MSTLFTPGIKSIIAEHFSRNNTTLYRLLATSITAPTAIWEPTIDGTALLEHVASNAHTHTMRNIPMAKKSQRQQQQRMQQKQQ